MPVFGGMMHVDLDVYRQMWLTGLVSNPVVELPVNAVNAGDTLISASYDARTGQVTIDKVRAAGGSAIVRIKGELVNTNDLGKIKINGGLGHVEVNNQTGAPLVVQDIYAGSNASAESSTSIVDLLDTHTGMQTMYTFRPGQGINVYTGSLERLDGPAARARAEQPHQRRRDRLQPAVRLAARVAAAGGVDPQRRHGERHPHRTSGPSSSRTTRTNPWQFFNWTTGTYQSADLPDSHLVFQPGLSDVFHETITASSNVTFGAWKGICYEGYGDIPGNIRNDQCANDPDRDADEIVSLHTYRYATDAHITLTMSVKASNPVRIKFAGHDRGLINITSNADVFLDGNLTNPNGDTNITSTGRSSRRPTRRILTNNLTLNASGGGVGTSSSPIEGTVTPGGVVSGTSNWAGFFLDLQSGATIGTITAGGPGNWGDVRLRVNGSLLGQNVATNISGRDLTLSTTVGTIGSSGHALQITAHATQLASGGFVHGALDATAPGDINVHQTSGNLVLDQVVSVGGDVTIDVTGGGIFDLRGQTAQAISDDDATALWTRLQLTSGLNAAARLQRTVTAYETQVDRAYFTYFQLIGVGTVDGLGAYHLNDAKVGLFRGQAEAQLGHVDRRRGEAVRRRPLRQHRRPPAGRARRRLLGRDRRPGQPSVRLPRRLRLGEGSRPARQRRLDGERAALRTEPARAHRGDRQVAPAASRRPSLATTSS